MLLINEIFGPTFQGEGRQTGQRCFFVRTATCNLECTWCDTPQTWVFSERKAAKHKRVDVPFNVKTESHKMSEKDVVDKLLELGIGRNDLIVISGGEPMLQQERIAKLIDVLRLENYYHYAFETAGTIKPEGWYSSISGGGITWTVSPKLSGSGNPDKKRINIEAFEWFVRQGADFKFVVTDQYDMLETDEFVQRFGVSRSNVWIMPEGINAVDVLDNARKLERWASEQKYNLTLRQHILLYGDVRGK
jgi:7-carboxy-7-deazaguanine synthase